MFEKIRALIEKHWDMVSYLFFGVLTTVVNYLVISAAKRYVTTDRPVAMEDMIELLIQQMTNNSNGAGVVDAAADLKAKGVSVRTLAKAIGMPHNTLSYQINKLTKGKEVSE